MIIEPVDDLPQVEVSEVRLDEMLGEIKQNSRNRRIAMFAPLALAAAVMATLLAAPPRYGGLALAEADATQSELPRVFGSNGVWRLAEPIAEVSPGPTTDSGPTSVTEVPTATDTPSFVLSPPDPEDLSSLPASTSTPPTSTSGQYPEAPDPLAGEVSALPDEAAAVVAPEDLDWSSFGMEIRTEPTVSAAENPSTPDPSASTEGTTPPAPSSSDDEDVTVAALPQAEQDTSEANPSTPMEESPDVVTPSSAVATITQRSVLVYSAHVSVTVQVVDDDSDVIDWCNTRVDWGDGSVTGVNDDADGVAMCTASCEYEATPSALGIDEEVTFTHVYREIIDASPRIYVATGDGCNYTLAELQLSPFTVVPY